MALSLATVFIVSAVVFIISLLYIFNVSTGILISSVKEKVDIAVYFRETAQTEDILEIKAMLSNNPEVKDVKYISREDALDQFTKRHEGDPVLMESITEVGRNPFLASLNIKATKIASYDSIVDFLQAEAYQDIVKKVDYFQRKPVIDRLYAMTGSMNSAGTIISLFLGLVALLVAFNAIRLAIYASREEISVMRLVGASDWFIRGPFIIEGIIIGLISAGIVFFVIFAFCFGLNGFVKQITGDISLVQIFVANFWFLVIIQVVASLGITAISSILAMRKYLEV